MTMMYIVDTNVLLRFAERRHPLHGVVRASIRKLREDGHSLRATSQNCIEFWNVATRPVSANGFGLHPRQAERLLRLIERLFPVLPDSPATYSEWRRLVTQHEVSGVQVHDARLVAAMKLHGISRILTLNPADFLRYKVEAIVATDPSSV
jgi:predicted nucleic acid-binding protein